MANITGWGRGTWNELAWDSPIPVVVTGVVATSAVGSVVVVPSIEVSVTNVIATGAVGAVTLESKYAVSGVAGTSAVGSESVTASALVSVTGVNASASTDNVTLESKYLVTGLSATTNLGKVLVYGVIGPSQTPNWVETSIDANNWVSTSPSQEPEWSDIAA
jgi:hypothetical protein